MAYELASSSGARQASPDDTTAARDSTPRAHLRLAPVTDQASEIETLESSQTAIPESSQTAIPTASVDCDARDQVGDVQDKRLPRRYVPSSSAVLFLLDLVFIGTAQLFVFGAIHDRLNFFGLTQLMLVTAISIAADMLLLYASGCYRRDTLVSPTIASSRLPVALGFGGIALFLNVHYVMVAIFPFAPVYFSIRQCVIIVLIGLGVSLGAAMASRVVFYAMVRRRWFRRRILVLGTGKRARYLDKLMAHAAHTIGNDLIFAPESSIGGKPVIAHEQLQGVTLEGSTRPIDAIARDFTVDEIVIALDERRGFSLERLLACRTGGIPVTDYTVFIERETGRVDINWLELSSLVYSNGFQIRLIDVVAKRFLDIFVSLTLLIISAPVLVAAVVAIFSEGGGQPLFRQERVTQNGRAFWLYKLRTMRSDAELHGPQWAAVNDPRVTRVGAFLRRTRIDEIPQLLNVLRGDMSLVGPRPERPVFVQQLSQEIRMYGLRHSVKSGLTGWAQINYPYGASSADAARKLEYDLYYIKNYSLVRDISIILQTLRVLVWPDGVR